MSNTTTSFKSRAGSFISSPASAGTADPPKRTTKRSPYAAQAGEQRGVQASPSTRFLDPASRNMVHCPAESKPAAAAADTDRGADAADDDGRAFEGAAPREGYSA